MGQGKSVKMHSLIKLEILMAKDEVTFHLLASNNRLSQVTGLQGEKNCSSDTKLNFLIELGMMAN